MSVMRRLLNPLALWRKAPLAGHSPTISLQRPVGVIVVGAGMIARRHLEVLKRMRCVEIRSVCAKHLVSARRLAEQFGIRSFHTGYREALTLPLRGNEVVLIATPPDTHYEIAMAAISSGRHLLVEKPSALNQDKVKEVASAAAMRELLAGSFASRFALSPLAVRLKEIVSSGQLGRIYRIEVTSRTRRQHYGIEYNERARWALSKDSAGGGPLLDWGIYALAWLDTVVNLPALTCIAGQTQHGLFPASLPEDIIYDVEEAAYGLWRGEDGLLLSLDVAWAEHAPPRRCALILGLKGGVEVRWVPPFHLSLFTVNEAGEPQDGTVDLPHQEYNAELSVIENFLAAVDSSRTLALPLSREAELMAMLMGCYRLAEKTQSDER